MRNIKYKYIDLFAGCGGASLGLFNAGWKGMFAVEKNEMAFRTLQFNLIDAKHHFEWPIWLPTKAHNIETFLKKYKENLVELRGTVDLLVGGPPCQGFSFAGRRNENDKRNRLVNSYIRFVDLVRPKVIFFENVKGFTVRFKKNNSVGRVYADYVLKNLSKMGYDVHAEIVNFGDFGIPQNRKRFILVGVINGKAKVFFDKLVANKQDFLRRKGLAQKVTVGEAISDLARKWGEHKSTFLMDFSEGVYGKIESSYQSLLRSGGACPVPDSHRFARHNARTVERFRYVLDNCLKGKNIAPELKRTFALNKHSVVPLAKDARSPTLTTLPDDYIHYSEPRILSVREYARIQSFDDWYEIKGPYTTGGRLRKTAVPRYSQIGNAIPPLFMEQAGEIFMELVDE